jgi:hypothetical protein
MTVETVLRLLAIMPGGAKSVPWATLRNEVKVAKMAVTVCGFDGLSMMI